MVRKINNFRFFNVTLLLIICILGGFYFLHKSTIFESFDGTTTKQINIEYYYNANDNGFNANWDIFTKILEILDQKKIYKPVKYDTTSDIGKIRMTKFNIINNPTVIMTDASDKQIGQAFNNYNANDIPVALIVYADAIIAPPIVNSKFQTTAYDFGTNTYKWCRCSNSDDNPFNN